MLSILLLHTPQMYSLPAVGRDASHDWDCVLVRVCPFLSCLPAVLQMLGLENAYTVAFNVPMRRRQSNKSYRALLRSLRGALRAEALQGPAQVPW